MACAKPPPARSDCPGVCAPIEAWGLDLTHRGALLLAALLRPVDPELEALLVERDHRPGREAHADRQRTRRDAATAVAAQRSTRPAAAAGGTKGLGTGVLLVLLHGSVGIGIMTYLACIGRAIE